MDTFFCFFFFTSRHSPSSTTNYDDFQPTNLLGSTDFQPAPISIPPPARLNQGFRLRTYRKHNHTPNNHNHINTSDHDDNISRLASYDLRNLLLTEASTDKDNLFGVIAAHDQRNGTALTVPGLLTHLPPSTSSAPNETTIFRHNAPSRCPTAIPRDARC